MYIKIQIKLKVRYLNGKGWFTIYIKQCTISNIQIYNKQVNFVRLWGLQLLRTANLLILIFLFLMISDSYFWNLRLQFSMLRHVFSHQSLRLICIFSARWRRRYLWPVVSPLWVRCLAAIWLLLCCWP